MSNLTLILEFVGMTVVLTPLFFFLNREPLKKCGCSRCYYKIPYHALKIQQGDELDGHYWNCECGSTLFIPLKEVV